MRIIAGEFRSRRLKTLPGLDTRPTPDRRDPSAETLDQSCDMIQEFDDVVLRQKGKTSWYFDPDDSSNGFGGTPAFVKFSTGDATANDEVTGTATISTTGK